MNKQKLRDSLHYRVRLFPVAKRKVPGGDWLPPIDDEWLVQSVDSAGIVHLSNPRTRHLAVLGHDRIHHFEHAPERDWDGLKHGLFVLHTQLVLTGDEILYIPLPPGRGQNAPLKASERRSSPGR